MSSPTFSDVWAQIRAAVKLLRETYNFASQNTPNAVGLIDAIVSGAAGDRATEAARAAMRVRTQLAEILDRGRDLLDPLILELGPIIKSPRTDPTGVLADLREYMVANSQTVVTRGITRGTVASGVGNVGDGTVFALTVDADDEPIEVGGPWVTVLECTADANTGRPSGAALFEASTSGAPAIDATEPGSGSAVRRTLSARVAADGLLRNASFTQVNSAATHPYAPWLASGGYAGISAVASGVRADRGTPTSATPGGTAAAVRFAASGATLYQVVTRDLDPARPVGLVVWCKPLSGCDGTLTAKLGSASGTLALSGVSGWSRLALATTRDAWYSQFKSTPLVVELTLTGVTTGSVLIDDVLLAPMERYNGRWMLAVTGATDFEVGDRFTFSDSSTNDRNIQGTLARLYGAYLPSASGAAATIADPG
jgi:hypothetical protein